MAVVLQDLLASQAREVRRERSDLRDFLCQGLRDVRVVPALKVCQGPPDLRDTPLPDRTVLPESRGVLVCRETEATPEKPVRKVRRVTPASTASVARLLFPDLQDLQDNLDSQGGLVLQV